MYGQGELAFGGDFRRECSACVHCGGDVPRQQLLDVVDRMLGDALQDVSQIGFRIKTVEFGRADEGGDRRRPRPAAIEPANSKQQPLQRRPSVNSYR